MVSVNSFLDDKKARITFLMILFSGIFLIFGLYFVFGAPTVAIGGSGSVNVNEDVGLIYNISVNNTDSGQDANITQVNLTLPAEFIYNNDNGTSVVAYDFSVSGSTLSWTNTTDYLINGSDVQYFWFNATGASPGEYNISVATVNASGVSYSNISVVVNDTTAPSSIQFVSPTPTNDSYVIGNLNINVTATDNGEIQALVVNVYNSTGIVNSTSSSGNNSVSITELDDGTYYFNATVNDTYGNANYTETRTITFTSSSFDLNGTVYDSDGNALNNSNITVTVRDSTNNFGIVTNFETFSNESGGFNMTLPDNSDWMYQPTLKKVNETYGYVQLVGQSLPSFPSFALSQVSGTEFFLRDAGTINLTAVNSTGDRINFRYQIKDTKLGYAIAEGFDSVVSEKVVYIQKDRNYSLMIFPQMSMSVSYDWDNFSSTSDYSFGLSDYNSTTSTLRKQFNTTMSYVRAYGYILNSSGNAAVSGWDEFTIIPYILEPGDMVQVEHGSLPHNLSGFFDPSNGDEYNLTSGYYNISLPSTVENSEVLLFASARNGTNYYGGVLNASFVYNPSVQNVELNITIFGLLGSPANISMDTLSGGQINISASKTTFNLLNSTNSSLSNVFAHTEVKLDYSAYGVKEFTWMSDVSQGGTAELLVPLLNVSSGVKEMNVYVGGGNYAPKRVSYTQSQLQNNQINVTITSFNPGDIDGASLSDLKVALYHSNLSCDSPTPGSGCELGGVSNGTDFDNFNPMNAVLGGGKLSFRMGRFSTGIVVHYVNVDLLASGPPDALFDDSESSGSTSGSFESAFRFGSGGPTIYDYVLISMPYTEGSNSTTGLNESARVNISIPTFYDDNWNVIWDTSTNGTNASSLAGNYSHYYDRQSEWQYLMDSSQCTTNSSAQNISTPCYIDTTENRIWVRIPHFSGAGPTFTGEVISADAAEESTTSSSGGTLGTTTASYWINTYSYNDVEFSEKGPINKELGLKNRIRLKIGGETHYVGVGGLTSSSAVINVSSNPQSASIDIGKSAKFDVDESGNYDVLVTLNGIISSKANLTLTSINEEVPAEVVDSENSEIGEENVAGENNGEEQQATGEVDSDGEKILWWLWVIVVIVLIGAGIAVYYYYFNMKKKK